MAVIKAFHLVFVTVLAAVTKYRTHNNKKGRIFFALCFEGIWSTIMKKAWGQLDSLNPVRKQS